MPNLFKLAPRRAKGDEGAGGRPADGKTGAGGPTSTVAGTESSLYLRPLSASPPGWAARLSTPRNAHPFSWFSSRSFAFARLADVLRPIAGGASAGPGSSGASAAGGAGVSTGGTGAGKRKDGAGAGSSLPNAHVLKALDPDEHSASSRRARIEAALRGALRPLQQYLATYERYTEFLRTDAKTAVAQSAKEESTLEDYQRDLKAHQDEMAAVEAKSAHAQIAYRARPLRPWRRGCRESHEGRWW